MADEDKLFDLSRPNTSKQRSMMADPARRKSVVVPTFRRSMETKAERKPVGDGLVNEALSKRLPSVIHKPVWNAGTGIKASASRVAPRPASISIAHRQESIPCRKDKVPTKFIIPRIHAEPLLEQYPLLAVDISNPSMYEENWLTYQEIAITQLVNNLFSASRSLDQVEEEGLQRIKFLEVYQDPSFAL